MGSSGEALDRVWDLEENAEMSARREEKMHLKKLHALRRGGGYPESAVYKYK